MSSVDDNVIYIYVKHTKFPVKVLLRRAISPRGMSYPVLVVFSVFQALLIPKAREFIKEKHNMSEYGDTILYFSLLLSVFNYFFVKT